MKTIKVMHKGEVVAEGKTYLSILANAGVPENVLASLPEHSKKALLKSPKNVLFGGSGLSSIMDRCITWQETEQGHSWWSHLHKQALQGKPLTPLPWPEGERDETINPQR